MTADDLHTGAWYRYHERPALYLGRAVGTRYFVFEVETRAGAMRVRIPPKTLNKEITKI